MSQSQQSGKKPWHGTGGHNAPQVVGKPQPQPELYSVETEMAVLGVVIVHNTLFPIIRTFLTADHFYYLRHQDIWNAFERIYGRDDPIDVLTLFNELEGTGKLNDIGGQAYITELLAYDGDWSNAETYARLLQRLHVRRQMLAYSDAVRVAAFNLQIDTEKAIVQCEAEWRSKILSQALRPTILTAGEAVEALWDEVDERNETGKVNYIKTGFRAMDEMYYGIPRGVLMLLAGRPGMGKSAFATSLGLSVSKHNQRVMIVSSEMSTRGLTARLFAQHSGRLRASDIMNQQLQGADYETFVKAAGEIGQLPLHIEHVPGLTVQQFIGTCLRQHAQTPLDLIICDGLYDMTSGGMHDNRTEEIKYMTHRIRDELVRALNVPVVITHQLSRAVESRRDKRPLMSDLEYGGEQAAEIVCLVYRDSVYNDATEFPNQVDLIFAKYRDNATGTLSMYFDRTTTAFMDGSKRRVDLRDLGSHDDGEDM